MPWNCSKPGTSKERCGAIVSSSRPSPKKRRCRRIWGYCWRTLGRYDQAVAEYKKALALDPNNAGIVRNLGLAYYKSGRIEEATREFSRARALAPDDLQTILLLCRLPPPHGPEPRGDRAAETAGAAEPPKISAIAYLLGTALIRDGQLQEGQKRVDKILRNGDSAEARFLLGNRCSRRVTFRRR